MRMTKLALLSIGACLLMGSAGCGNGKTLPVYTEVGLMPGLDGGLDGGLNSGNRLKSPVLRDVYDGSIPEEVYDTP